jgi:restriction system protein
LLLDYEDFLRQRGKRQWKKEDAETREVRAVGLRRDPTDRSDRTDPMDHRKRYSHWLDAGDPAIVANTVLCLIHQANYLLDQQIAGLEREFVSAGGYTEQLATARLAARRRQEKDRSDPSDRTDRSDLLPVTPTCPACGKPMVVRTARKGERAGSQFWGCSGYPDCKGTRPA